MRKWGICKSICSSIHQMQRLVERRGRGLCSPDLIRRASIEKGEGVWGSQGFAAAKCLSLFWLAFGGRDPLAAAA